MAAPNPRAMSMNALIAQAASRRDRPGILDRLTGAQLDERRQDRFNEALARVESAHKTGDHVLIAQAEEHLDTVLDEARAARAQVEQDTAEPAPEPPAVSFDGGARRNYIRRDRPVGMNDVIRREAAASRALADAARRTVA